MIIRDGPTIRLHGPLEPGDVHFKIQTGAERILVFATESKEK